MDIKENVILCPLGPVLREPTPDDEALVIDSLALSSAKPMLEAIPWIARSAVGEFLRGQARRAVKNLHPLIACSPRDAWHVYGYALQDRYGNVVWLYVKLPYRDCGLEACLLTACQARVPTGSGEKTPTPGMAPQGGNNTHPPIFDPPESESADNFENAHTEIMPHGGAGRKEE